MHQIRSYNKAAHSFSCGQVLELHVVVRSHAIHTFCCTLTQVRVATQTFNESLPAGSGSASMWPQLTSLKCLRNSIPVMDASLATLPALQICDLSSNNIGIVQGLNTCSSLMELILSSNCIESVAQIGLCSGPLRRLVLQV